MTDDELIPVFIPALGAILIAAEDKKGEPLTNDQVLAIRDSAACIMMTNSDAATLAESRGYIPLMQDEWVTHGIGCQCDCKVGGFLSSFQATLPHTWQGLSPVRNRGFISVASPNIWFRSVARCVVEHERNTQTQSGHPSCRGDSRGR
jgi:hypothetical protein